MDRVRAVGIVLFLSKKREKMETIPSIGTPWDMGVVKVATLSVLNLCIPGSRLEMHLRGTRTSAYRYKCRY